MFYAYPAKLTPDEDGRLVVSFPDLPAALTDGADRVEALAEAVDCLATALMAYVDAGELPPTPSSAKRGQRLVVLPTLVAAKIALHLALREAGISQSELARRLGQSENAARRLLHLDHRSHIGQVEEALAVLGKQLALDVRDAA